MDRYRSLLLLAGLSAPVPAQQLTLHGTVRDSLGAPVPAVSVAVGARSSLSDSVGLFALKVKKGEGYLLSFRKVGFEPRSVVVMRPADTIRVVLARLTTLASVNVTERALVPEKYRFTTRYDEFFRRRNSSIGGHYFDQEDIRKYGGVARVLNTVPGVVARELNGLLGLTLRRCGSARPTLVIDGVQREFSALNMLHVAQIELVEIYRGVADLPAEARGSGCGALVIYTR